MGFEFSITDMQTKLYGHFHSKTYELDKNNDYNNEMVQISRGTINDESGVYEESTLAEIFDFNSDGVVDYKRAYDDKGKLMSEQFAGLEENNIIDWFKNLSTKAAIRKEANTLKLEFEEYKQGKPFEATETNKTNGTNKEDTQEEIDKILTEFEAVKQSIAQQLPELNLD